MVHSVVLSRLPKALFGITHEEAVFTGGVRKKLDC